MGINPGGNLGFSNEAKPNWSKSPVDAPKPQADAAPKDLASAGKPSGVTAPTGAPAAAPVDASAAADGAAQISGVPAKQTWQASMADLVQKMLEQNVSNTPMNKSLAMLMMQYGVELSSDNFEQVYKMLKGKTQKNALESAIITLSKGLGESSKSVDFLQQYLNQNKQLAQQLRQTQQAFTNFQTAIQSGKELDSGILTNLSTVLQQFDDEFKTLNKKATGNRLDLQEFKRGGLLKNLYMFHQLLDGLITKYGKDVDKAGLIQKLQVLKDQIHDTLGSITSQLILSKDSEKHPAGVLENFAYWQIPNPMASQPSTIDILIKKDPQKKNEDQINTERTKVVLHFETDILGTITLIVKIMGKKIWYTFNSEREPTTKLIHSFQAELRDKMTDVGYEMVGFSATRKKIDIKKFLLPTQDLDNVIRINAEV